jgi:hypothetical protein
MFPSTLDRNSKHQLKDAGHGQGEEEEGEEEVALALPQAAGLLDSHGFIPKEGQMAKAKKKKAKKK